MEKSISRRTALQSVGLASATLLTSSLSNRIEAADNQIGTALKGRINHSACRWCYSSIPLAALGIKSS